MKKYALLCLLVLIFACAKNPADESAVHRHRADEFMAAGKVREASIEYQAALQKWPDDVDAQYGFARTLETMGEHREYRASLAKILRLKPTHREACVAMGEVEYASGRYEAALTLAGTALTEDKTFLPAKKLQARALARLERGDEARKLWEEMLSSSSPEESLYSDAAAFEAWESNQDRAIEILDAGLKTYPRSIELHLVRAGLLMAKGELDAAGAELLLAMELEPDNPGVHTARAKYLYATGDGRAAEGLLEAADKQFQNDEGNARALALQRARLYLEQGAISRARATLSAEWERRPGNPQVAAELADILVALGDTAQALELLHHVEKADAYGRRARLIAARVFLQNGQPERALGAVGRLVAGGDLGLDVHFLYARALAETGKYAMARIEYFLILRRNPQHHLARMDYCQLLLQLQDYDRVLDELKRLPQEVSSSERAQHIKSIALLNSGDVDASRRTLSTMLKGDPDNAEALKSMGDVERRAKNYRKALDYYDKAIDRKRDSIDSLLAKSSLLYKNMAEPKKSLDILDAYQRQFGEDYRILNYKASIYLAQTAYDSALMTIDRSLLLEPNAWETRYMKAMIHKAQGQDPKAIIELEQAIDLGPARSLPYNALAQMQLRTGNREAAKATYQKLLDANPGDPLTSNNLANLFLEEGNLTRGLELAKRAHVGAPKDPYIMDTLGWALELSGDFQAAFPFLEEAAKKLPVDPEILFHRATNLHSLGKAPEARQVFEEVVRIAPDSSWATRARESLQVQQ